MQSELAIQDGGPRMNRKGAWREEKTRASRGLFWLRTHSALNPRNSKKQRTCGYTLITLTSKQNGHLWSWHDFSSYDCSKFNLTRIFPWLCDPGDPSAFPCGFWGGAIFYNVFSWAEKANPGWTTTEALSLWLSGWCGRLTGNTMLVRARAKQFTCGTSFCLFSVPSR